MKRKVMLQFMIAMLVIGLMASFINTTVVSFLMYATSGSVAAQKIMVNFSPDVFNIQEVGNIKFENGLPQVNDELLKALKKSNSFIQVLDSSGKEIESINKPDYIKMSYLPEEMAKLIGSPEVVQYKLQAAANENGGTVGVVQNRTKIAMASGNESATPGGTKSGTPSGKESVTPGGKESVTPSGKESATPSGTKSAAVSGNESVTPSGTKSAAVSGKESVTPSGTKSGMTSGTKTISAVPVRTINKSDLSGLISSKSVIYDMFIQVPNGDPNSQVRMIIGVMRPKINISMFFYSFLRFLVDWNPQKLFTTFLTLLVSLLMGYLFARRMAKPVVNITNGIAQMASGNYDTAYPEKGLYCEVYASLNNMGRALQQNEEERKRLEKMRSDWITNISHDLKTPLASIKGYGELLLEPDYNLTPEERKKYSEVIFNKSNYIEHLINDLKLVQKLRNNMLPLKKTDNNLVELLREIVISILNDPQYEDRAISFESETELVCLSYDKVLLQRAFTNIIYNAILHNPADTQILVKIYRPEGGVGNSAMVEIIDNGRGIPEEDRKNLFERYYRGTSTDSLHAGSGLGLAIAKEVIEAHGGRIELESEVGKGTIIRVLFVMH